MPTKTYGRMPREAVSGASAAPYQMTAKRRRPAGVNWTVLERATSRPQLDENSEPRVISGRVVIHLPHS